MDTEYCPENSAYKKCVFRCPTYKEYIEAKITQNKNIAKDSYESACGKFCNNKPVWPRERCESTQRELSELSKDYKSKCGSFIPSLFNCPITSCKDGMLGIDMCGSGEMGGGIR